MSWTNTFTNDDRRKMDTGTKTIRMTMPTILAVDEPFSLHLTAYRRDGYPDLTASARVRFQADSIQNDPELMKRLPKEVRFETGDEGVLTLEGLCFPKTGIYRIRAITEYC